MSDVVVIRRCEYMPIRYNKDKSENPSISKRLSLIPALALHGIRACSARFPISFGCASSLPVEA